MTNSSSLIGMPWQLAKSQLQAAHIPFKVIIGDNFNRFFEIASEGYYVARITESEDMLISFYIDLWLQVILDILWR